jgi:hypothetical protein
MSPAEKKACDVSACHWMPCKIKYDGLAPIQQYFHPETVKRQDLNDDAGTNSQIEQPVQVATTKSLESHMAASFRGRGILAQNVHQLPDNILGCVFTQSSTDTRKLQTGETFRQILEWEHEWNANGLLDNELDDEIYTDSSVHKGLALVELMKTVHDPIPVENEIGH